MPPETVSEIENFLGEHAPIPYLLVIVSTILLTLANEKLCTKPLKYYYSPHHLPPLTRQLSLLLPPP